MSHAPRARTLGAILAGGRAARFGGAPKGLASLGGARLLDRVADALRGAADDLVLVANDPGAGAWLPGVPVVRDAVSDAGPLGGIHTALAHAAGATPAFDAAIVVAWDMPNVTVSLLAELRALGESGGWDVTAPAHAAARHGVEPLCAWWRAACVTPVARAIDAGARSPARVLAALRTAHLPAARLSAHGDPATLLASVNTPHDLARLQGAT